MHPFIKQIKNKRLVFITTKNVDYIRNIQEIRILEKEAKSVELICSNKKNYVARVWEIWCKLLFLHKNFDVVFIGFAPQLVALFFRKFRHKIIIIDFFISVYDTLVNDRKKLSARNPIAKMCHWIDSYVIKKADMIITDTKADAEYFIDEFKGEKDKFETFYLEADKTIYYPRKQQKGLNLLDKYVVLYFGSILPLQGVDVVLDAVKLLKEETRIFFQIIGPISKEYSKPIQNNVEYIDWLEQKELAEYIANADLCLAGHFNGNIDKAKRTVPGKAYIYSAMGKTMILGDNRANHELYSTSDKVYWTTMSDSIALSKSIKEAMNHA